MNSKAEAEQSTKHLRNDKASMPFSTMIAPVSSSDIPAAVQLIYHQKISLTINRVMWKVWPSEDAQKARSRSAVEGSINKTSVECLKVFDDKSGEVLGLLVLNRKRPAGPDGKEESEASAETKVQPAPPEELDSEVLAVVVNAMDEIGKDVAEVDHIEITVLVVKEPLRGKGLGSQLMQVAFERAKAEHVPLVVGSEPAGYNFFTKLGFRELRHCDMDLSKYAPPFTGYDDLVSVIKTDIEENRGLGMMTGFNIRWPSRTVSILEVMR